MSGLAGALVAAAVVAVAGLLLAGWWLRRRLLVVTVHGPSMLPRYRDGDRLLVRRRPGRLPQPGEVVVVDLPPFEQVVDLPSFEEVADPKLLPEHLGAPEPPVVEWPGGLDPPGRESTVVSNTWQPSRVVKRVAAVAGDRTPAGVERVAPVVPPGSLVLLGDNSAASVDSRHYGFVGVDRVIGVVVRQLR